jgi:hypothetical protein
MREAYQFQPTLVRKYDAAHRFLGCSCLWFDFEAKNVIGNVRTDGELASPTRSSLSSASRN